VIARQLADELENQADLGAGVSVREELMLVNAAQAAVHASRMSWLAGRARDEESARAIECATSAVQTALGLAQLDLGAIVDQVLPQAVAPMRPISDPASIRILKALPT
jgi:hypothetical protein